MSFWGAIGSIGGFLLGGPTGATIGGSIGGAIDGSNAAGDAADAQNAATQSSIGEQRRQFDLTREDYAPYRETGRRALGQLESDINAPVTQADVMQDPGYQFGLTQGQQALDRKIAAMGGRVSGAALKAASGFATGQASAGYGAAYQRRQDRLNRLASLANVGQTATNGSAMAGQNSANAISGLISSQGDANAAARLTQGNVWAGAGNQIAAMYGRKQASPVPYGTPPYAPPGTANASGSGYGWDY